MVLQKSPMKANIWGYLRNSTVNDQVFVELNSKKYNALYIKGMLYAKCTRVSKII